MLHLVIETNILHQNKLDSESMLKLKRLVDADALTIHVPEFVIREYSSKLILEAKDSLRNALNTVASVNKKLSGKNDPALNLEGIVDQINESSSLIEARVDDSIEDWTIDSNVKIVRFKPNDIHGVIDDYFNGTGVYKKVKERSDIPDAIINTCIKQVCDAVDHLYVATNDGVFKKHLDTINKVTTVRSLVEFLELKPNASLLTSLDRRSVRLKIINDLISEDVFLTAFTKLLRTSRELDLLHLSGDGEILNIDTLKVDTFAETLDFPDPHSIKGLTFNTATPSLKNEFFLTFSFSAFSTIGYACDYPDYLRLEKDQGRSIELYSSGSEGVCEIHESRESTFFGHLILHIPEEVKPALIPDELNDLNNDLNEINYEFEITGAVLKD